MSAYLNGIGNISPQNTWQENDFLSSIISSHKNVLTCVEPDYSSFIGPANLRRMSRILKMGNAAAAIALKQAEVKVPDGVITGTGYGCLEDTSVFLAKITSLKETALNPTPFMQSTHNTIGSQIALLLQCQGYNQTYVHDSFAFEHSLLDALMFLEESPESNLLVGGVEEVTYDSHFIKNRFGIYSQDGKNSAELLCDTTDGTIEGEGAAYFVLSGKQQHNSIAKVKGVRTMYKPTDTEILSAIPDFLNSVGLQTNDIDLLIVGKNGHKQTDFFVADVANTLFNTATVAGFKHLSGEHCVASSFALWMAAKIIQCQSIPETVKLRGNSDAIDHVLIYNPYFYNHHSLILISGCHATIK